MSGERDPTDDGRDAAIYTTLAALLSDAPHSDAPDHGVMHRGVVQRVKAIWDDVPDLRGSAAYSELLGQPSWRERWVDWVDKSRDNLRNFIPRRRAFFAVAVTIGLLAIAFPWAPLFAPASHYETALAETREIRLSDGSIVTLGARSAVDIDFEGNHRIVRLAAGEAFFDVAKDARRPFEVLVGNTHVHVAGTRFNVNRSGQGVRVAVLEGAVQLTEQIPGAVTRNFSLAAGQQYLSQQVALPTTTAAFPAVERASPAIVAPQITALNIATPGGWRTGNLAYENVPLVQIVADANRYYQNEIRVVSSHGSSMRLTTAFRSGQIEDFLDTVERALPVKVIHEADGGVVIADR